MSTLVDSRVDRPDVLTASVLSLPELDLDDVLQRASLQRRVDRKYLVPLAVAAEVVEHLEGWGVLVVAGRHRTQYRSTYLDSADLRCCRDHLQGRRLRWKARQRLYVEDGLCRLEVKVRSGRGDTVKHVSDLAAARYGLFAEAERSRLGTLLATAGTDADPAALGPVLEVGYHRSTLADLDAGLRVTLDTRVVATPLRPDATAMRIGTVVLDPRLVVLETKGGPRPGPVDALLLERGLRPTSMSKYATCAALLSPGIADNPVRHHRGRHLHVTAEEQS